MRGKTTVRKTEQKQNQALSLLVLTASMLVAAVVVHVLTGGKFITAKNVEIMISNSIYPTFIAWALCFLFACGYTDLSMGGVLVLGSFAACAFGNAMGYPGVILGGLAAGTLLVCINFGIFTATGIPSWIASISLALIYEALTVFLRTGGLTRRWVDAELDRNLRALGRFPLNLIVLIVGLVIVYFVYNRTTIGLNVRAVGGSAGVSRAMGINLSKTILAVGLIAGLLMGVACIVQESYNGKTFAMSGLTSIQMIFKPLAIALLAQILQKRINIILAAPFCSIIIYGVFNIMTFFGIPSGTLQDVFLGAFVIAFGVIGQRRVKGVVK